jgi:single-strand DNA-binding protein
MSNSINSIQLLGRLGQDPETTWSENGIRVTASLAVTIDQDTTDWYPLTAFGKTAEILANYVRKGEQVNIQGRVSVNRWVDKVTDEPRSRVQIIVDRVGLIGSNSRNALQTV